MRSLLDAYDLPHRVPAAIRIWLLMLAVPAVAVGLWLVLPHTAAVVVLVGLAVLALVFGGLARILNSRQFNEPPARRPAPLPSLDGETADETDGSARHAR